MKDKEFKIGDIVVDINLKLVGNIIHINDASYFYPILVSFSSKRVDSYTRSGKCMITDLKRSLYVVKVDE
jgi:hypothetical protein